MSASRTSLSRKILFAVLLLLVTFLPLVLSQNAASAKENDCTDKRVIVVMIDELTWQDLTPTATPYLDSFASESYIASLSPGRLYKSRSAISTFTSISAGARTFDNEEPLFIGHTSENEYTLGIADIVKENKNGLYESHIGTLEKTLTKNKIGSALLDPGIVEVSSEANSSLAILANPLGDVSNVFLSDSRKLEAHLSLYDKSVLFAHFNKSSLEAVDDQVETLVKKYAEDDTDVIVMGAHTFTSSPKLLVAAIHTRDDRGVLSSATRQRDGLIEIQDIGPTVLNSLCISLPTEVEGSPVSFEDSGSYKTERDHLIRDNTTAMLRGTINGHSVNYILMITLVLIVLFIWGTISPRINATLLITQKDIALGAMSFFAATFLVNIFHPLDTQTWIIQILASTVLLFECAYACERWKKIGYLFSLSLIVLILFVDIFTNNIFQSNSVFGYSFINNSRSYGFSNIGSAAFSFGVIFLVVNSRKHFVGRAKEILCAAIFVTALGLIGHPRIGADVGGALSSAPAYIVAFLYITNRRMRLRGIALTGIITVAATSLLCYLDYLRPADQRSHLGRLVDSLLHEGVTPFIHTLERKFMGMISTFTSVWCIIAIITFALLYKIHQIKPFRREYMAPIIVLALFGTFLNDAGMLVGGSILFLALCASFTHKDVHSDKQMI